MAAFFQSALTTVSYMYSRRMTALPKKLRDDTPTEQCTHKGEFGEPLLVLP